MVAVRAAIGTAPDPLSSPPLHKEALDADLGSNKPEETHDSYGRPSLDQGVLAQLLLLPVLFFPFPSPFPMSHFPFRVSF